MCCAQADQHSVKLASMAHGQLTHVQLVPILPVVMKADTMLMKECINYRKEVSSRMADPQAPITMFEFSKATLEACGITDSAMTMVAAARPPYLVRRLARDTRTLVPWRTACGALALAQQ